MLVQITTTHQPATDLGFLLHKHPEKFQSVELSHGKAHIFYPEATEQKATAALLVDIDPINMVRSARKLSGKGFALGNYVNDRPYVSSSFMSVALAKAFSTAMNGTCTGKPELANQKIPLEVQISVVSAPKGGEMLIRKLFEPLGYQLEIERHTLDEKFPDWGESKYYSLVLKNNLAIKELLSHLYVLLPVLDNDKHYYVSQNEIDKLIDKGKDWLESHPEKEQIVKRYLINLGSLSKQAMNRLVSEESNIETDEIPNELKEKKQNLHEQRLQMAFEKLKQSGAERVLDLGCGEGKLIKLLLKEKQFKEIVGIDISFNELKKAKDRLRWEQMSISQKERITLFQGALTYRDKRLDGYDAAALVEVIEHMDENRLHSFERVLFEFSRPKTIVLTTPNKEYNAVFENMNVEQMRHDDHRFEWTRAEFENWANRIAKDHHYSVAFFPIGEMHESFGAPSQMAVFEVL